MAKTISDPAFQAWVASFLDENHLNHLTSPDMVASPAQVRFMVALEEGQHYYPCPEPEYHAIISKSNSPLLREKYNQVWKNIYGLVEKCIDDQQQRDFLFELLNIKYLHETANNNVIPSRVEKRLFKLFMVTTQIEDPLREDKAACNKRAEDIYLSEGFIKSVNRPAGEHTPAPCFPGESIESARRHLDATKLLRLLQASIQTDFRPEARSKTEEEWDDLFARPVSGDGWSKLENFLLSPREDLLGYWCPRTILYIPEKSGEIVYDLAVVKFLVRLGHVVVMAVKSAAFYDQVCLGDIVHDPVIRKMVQRADLITNPRLTKNQVAQVLRNDAPFNIISDGTMEELNLMLTSVSFARFFKEVDGIIAKGSIQKSRFFDTPFEFTQDVYCLTPGEDGSLGIWFKPRSSRIPRFSTSDLEGMAQKIIDEMRKAKNSGMTVMFYSGIVGSIPGETETAIKVMTTFIDELKEQQAGVLIINPSQHFEPGLDADDLMYMWEIVQRSGYIDIWRFQTHEDIERSFVLMGQKMPPQWVGKDSTFSTGCTKERAIAADVQKQNPELQIIGPDQERFIRRSEYGIGLFADTRLTEVYEH